MFVRSIRLGKTVPVETKAGTEYQKVELEAELSHTDDYATCKAELEKLLDGSVSSGATVDEPKTAPRTSRRPAKTAKPDVEAEAETQAEEPKKPDAKKKVTRKKKATTSRRAKPKITVYDRKNKDHKAELSSMLDNEFEGWDTDDGLKVGIKVASTELNGKDFLGEDGVMLPDFVNEFCELIEKNAE